jgi:hypothetical protein
MLGPDQVPQPLVEEAAAPRDSPEVALSGVFTTSRIQLRARPRTQCSGPIGAVLALREDAARLLLELRWNEQFGRAHWERVVGALSYQLHGDALRFEPALRDLRLDQR